MIYVNALAGARMVLVLALGREAMPAVASPPAVEPAATSEDAGADSRKFHREESVGFGPVQSRLCHWPNPTGCVPHGQDIFKIVNRMDRNIAAVRKELGELHRKQNRAGDGIGKQQ